MNGHSEPSGHPGSGVATHGHGVASAVATSALTQGLARIVHMALNVVASLGLIHYLGPTGYGDYVFVVTLTAALGLPSDFGLTKVAVREMARDPSSAATVLGTSIFGRLMMAGACWLLTQVVMLAMGVRPEMRAAAAVVSLLFFSDALLGIVAVFHVRVALQYEALIIVIGQALETAAIVWLVAHEASLLQIVAVPVLGGMVSAILAAYIARRHFRAALAVEMRRLPQLFRQALPVGLTLMVVVVNLKIDSILLGVFATATDVGLYGAAYKPVEYLLIAMGAMINAMFPVLARWHRTDIERFRAAYRRGTDAILAAALPIAVVLVLLSDRIVAVMYPVEFAAAAIALRVLSVALVLMIFNAWQSAALLAGRRQGLTLAYDVAALVVNAGLNIVLSARLGYMGAALAALVASVLAATCSLIATRQTLGASPNAATLWALILANSALGGSLMLLIELGIPWLAAAVLAGLAYPGWLLLFRATNWREIRMLVPTRGPAMALAGGVDPL